MNATFSTSSDTMDSLGLKRSGRAPAAGRFWSLAVGESRRMTGNAGRGRRNPNAPVDDVRLDFKLEPDATSPFPPSIPNSGVDEEEFDDGFFDEEQPLRLQPTDPITDESRKRMRANESYSSSLDTGRVRSPNADHDPFAEPDDTGNGGGHGFGGLGGLPLQFSIRHILIANVVLAVTLALLQAAAPQFLAFALGVIAFGVFIGVTVYQPTQPQAYYAAWGFLGLYVIMAVVALIAG